MAIGDHVKSINDGSALLDTNDKWFSLERHMRASCIRIRTNNTLLGKRVRVWVNRGSNTSEIWSRVGDWNTKNGARDYTYKNTDTLHGTSESGFALPSWRIKLNATLATVVVRIHTPQSPFGLTGERIRYFSGPSIEQYYASPLYCTNKGVKITWDLRHHCTA